MTCAGVRYDNPAGRTRRVPCWMMAVSVVARRAHVWPLLEVVELALGLLDGERASAQLLEYGAALGIAVTGHIAGRARSRLRGARA